MRKMKDSGIEWMGEIPEDWKISKYKKYACSGMGKTILAEETVESGIPIYSATQEDKIFGYINDIDLILTNGDLIIPARGNSIGYVTFVTDKKATCTQTTIYSKINGINNRFLYYCCLGLSKYWFSYDNTAIPQITVKQVQNNLVPIPSELNQNLIATFLNYKCSRIDSIITKEQTIIEKLKEYKLSLITETVTKGLDRSIQMKDSGIEWIGKTPLKWEIAKIKKLIKINNGREIDYEVEKNNDSIDVYGSGGVFKYTEEYLFEGEAVLFGRKGTIGKPLFVNQKFWTVDTMYYCTSLSNIKMKFIFYILTIFPWDTITTKTALPSVVGSAVGDQRLAYPDLYEQGQIINLLDTKCSKIDQVIKGKEEIVEKLMEYKKTLIYEVVTGKREV